MSWDSGEFRIQFQFEMPEQIEPVTAELEKLIRETTSIKVTKFLVGRGHQGGYLIEDRKLP